MFTGLIEEIGVIRGVKRTSNSMRLEIAASIVLDGMKNADSIAIDGACQTVVAVGDNSFSVEALAETLKKTTLGNLRAGARVHLERALLVNGRFDGHIVQGHISCRAKVRELRHEGENVYLVLSLPEVRERYCVQEGSIAVNGVSLTICSLAAGMVEINLIPHTCANTTLGDLKAGDDVNIETDIIARYVERLFNRGDSSTPQDVTTKVSCGPRPNILGRPPDAPS